MTSNNIVKKIITPEIRLKRYLTIKRKEPQYLERVIITPNIVRFTTERVKFIFEIKKKQEEIQDIQEQCKIYNVIC